MNRAFFRGGKEFYTQTVDAALAEIERLPGRHLYFLDGEEACVAAKVIAFMSPFPVPLEAQGLMRIVLPALALLVSLVSAASAV